MDKAAEISPSSGPISEDTAGRQACGLFLATILDGRVDDDRRWPLLKSSGQAATVAQAQPLMHSSISVDASMSRTV
jgi:hypothetical protein